MDINRVLFAAGVDEPGPAGPNGRPTDIFGEEMVPDARPSGPQLAWTGADDPVPPFPQEPAPGSLEAQAQAIEWLLEKGKRIGSPAAVEQAAETIRPCGSCGGRGYVPDEGAGSRACRDCNSDGHLPTFPDEPAPELLAEVGRLREENAARVAETARYLEGFKQATKAKGQADDRALQARSRQLDAEEQRDALADALEEYRLDHDSEPRPEVEDEGCSCQRCVKARAALRKAGRLP